MPKVPAPDATFKALELHGVPKGAVRPVWETHREPSEAPYLFALCEKEKRKGQKAGRVVLTWLEMWIFAVGFISLWLLAQV